MVEKIAFSDFQKLDFRVGKIIEADLVEGSEKLMKLMIRIGSEKRTLVAGIAKYYAPDELLGKRVVVFTNIEPRKIKGIESEGMLLAACTEDESIVSLLTVDSDEVPDGTKIF